MHNWIKLYIADSRSMEEVEDESISLIITSPPYWHIKDYGVENQIGYGQTLHEYLKDLYRVWLECFRVLKPGRRLCINVGDQFARSIIYGRYKVIPIHSEIISQCEKIGFDYMGSIIWQKKTTMNTTGGAVVMGSYPYPPNGLVEIDYEYILIFKKPGGIEKIAKDIKEKSKLTKEEWKEYFSGHWKFGGEKQINHEAMFPEELPKRLIKMFSFIGETVLDPFVGSGTTIKVANLLQRNAIGYEINEKFLDIIKQKISFKDILFTKIDVIKRETKTEVKPIDYTPSIQDVKPEIDPKKLNFKKDSTYKVIDILSEDTIKLNTGLNVKLLGVKILDKEKSLEYLKSHVLKKEVLLKFDKKPILNENMVFAYVYLKNKIFINAYLIKSGMAKTDTEIDFSLKEKFLKLEKELINE